MLQLVSKISAGTSIAAGQRATIWRNAMNQIGEMRVKTWYQNQDTLSRTAVCWSRSFRGVDAYVDPVNSQTVELPTGYKDAWSNAMGDYVLSIDPSFNPNTDPILKKHNWHKMNGH